MPNPPLTEAVYYILLSLTEPLHGYGIMQRAEQLSSGRVRLAQRRAAAAAAAVDPDGDLYGD